MSCKSEFLLETLTSTLSSKVHLASATIRSSARATVQPAYKLQDLQMIPVINFDFEFIKTEATA